jgi:Fe-S cluster assembly protein SufD
MSVSAFNARLEAEFAVRAAELPEAVLPMARRRAALDQLLGLGLPGLRDDAWRYSNLRPLQGATLGAASGDALPPSPEVLELLRGVARPAEGTVNAARLVFVDGRLAPALSDPTVSATLQVLAADAEPATPAHGADTRFALLNDIFALAAARFRVSGECHLELIFIAGDAAASYPRVRLELAPGARLTLVERHLGATAGGSLTSAVTELQIGRDAHCQYYRAQDLDVAATHIEALHARLDAGAQLEAVLLQLGGGAVRSTVKCELAGRGAGVQLNAVSLADANRTLDSALTVLHAAPDTTSQQELRAIAADRSSIAFQSCVAVGSSAPGADSRQSLKGLVAGATAEVNLRPQLEIDTDAVRASHGATTGAIDEAMLFYLLSRGLDRETARQLLEWAFIEAVIGKIPLAVLRREFEERAVAHLGNSAALEVLA